MTDMDGDLFWKLLEAEHPKAERFCRKIAADRQDGDDLYHDALLAAWRKFGTLRNVDSISPLAVPDHCQQIQKPTPRAMVAQTSNPG